MMLNNNILRDLVDEIRIRPIPNGFAITRIREVHGVSHMATTRVPLTDIQFAKHDVLERVVDDLSRKLDQ